VRWAIIDTNIYIGHWEQGKFDQPLSTIRRSYIVRHSAVVLYELRRGARTSDAQKLVATLRRLAASLWEPTASDWWEAGRLIREIGDAEHWDKSKRRDFQNDALIALTARRHGATVVISNQGDFDLLARKLGISILAVRD